ncbi:MAG: hypothetical protein F6K26_23440 [Moorea sp. SIO2I5]|nr:hypothetical protein [Moorena sp. SIO2I5]
MKPQKAFQSQVTQDGIKPLDKTIEAFNTRDYGFPKLNKFGRYQSLLFPQFKTSPIQGNPIQQQLIGLVKITWHSSILFGFKIKRCSADLRGFPRGKQRCGRRFRTQPLPTRYCIKTGSESCV